MVYCPKIEDNCYQGDLRKTILNRPYSPTHHGQLIHSSFDFSCFPLVDSNRNSLNTGHLQGQATFAPSNVKMVSRHRGGIPPRVGSETSGFCDTCVSGFATCGRFLKWWYPQIIHFNRDFHYKPSILGYHYSWKHPCMSLSGSFCCFFLGGCFFNTHPMDFKWFPINLFVVMLCWTVLGDEQMNNGWIWMTIFPTTVNDEEMSNKVGVEHQSVRMTYSQLYV